MPASPISAPRHHTGAPPRRPANLLRTGAAGDHSQQRRHHRLGFRHEHGNHRGARPIPEALDRHSSLSELHLSYMNTKTAEQDVHRLVGFVTVLKPAEAKAGIRQWHGRLPLYQRLAAGSPNPVKDGTRTLVNQLLGQRHAELLRLAGRADEATRDALGAVERRDLSKE